MLVGQGGGVADHVDGGGGQDTPPTTAIQLEEGGGCGFTVEGAGSQG